MSDETATVSIDLQSRRIMMFGDFDDSSCAQVVHGLLAMNDSPLRRRGSRRTDPIEFWLHSSGGSLTAACAIADVMRFIDANVVTVGVGRVCSAASLPLLLGDARLVFPRTEIVMHGTSQGVNEDGGRPDARWLRQRATNFEAAAKMADASNAVLIDALVSRCGWTPAEAQRVIGDGADHAWCGGAVIVAAGLADAVYGVPTEGE